MVDTRPYECMLCQRCGHVPCTHTPFIHHLVCSILSITEFSLFVLGEGAVNADVVASASSSLQNDPIRLSAE